MIPDKHYSADPQGLLMETFEVGVEKDHIELIAKAKPLNAIAELIWNAYDADATEVRVDFEEGDITKLGLIRVTDNGTGIPYDHALEFFKNIGGSWKRTKRRTNAGRPIHGLKGQGRIKAFALGTNVVWHSSCEGKYYSIRGNNNNLKKFELSDLAPATDRGCTVEITDILKDFEIGREHGFADEIRDRFALQLYEDPNFSIVYDGLKIDALEAISGVTPIHVEASLDSGAIVSGDLDVVEWRRPIQRKLLLCLPGKFSFHEMAPGIQARGFNFTAYLTSQHFQELADENREGLIELDRPSQALIEAAKDAMRVHFREREAERSRAKIEEWKATGIYPYSGTVIDPVERNERQVFDVVALNLSDYSSEFEASPKKTQKLIFKLLKAAVESGPTVLPELLTEVINLPQERQEEMAKLLEKTSLSAIIEAAKEVTNRLDFIKALQILIFEPKSKQQLLERSQLHRIIAQDAWLFGEQYNLVNDDEDLTAVLRSHLRLLGQDRKDLAPDVDEKVLDAEGKNGIVDLMLSQRIPLPTDEKRKHLVIELKRPAQPVNEEVLLQINRYAQAVAQDDRFKHSDVEWDFVAISNTLSDGVTLTATQRDRPLGLAYEYSNPAIRVWVKTWGQVIQEAEGRLTFYRRRLDYQANEAQALEYLRSVNPDLLSREVRARIQELDESARAAE